MKDINTLNEFIAEHGNRNPDDLLDRPFRDWCATAQIVITRTKEKTKKTKVTDYKPRK